MKRDPAIAVVEFASIALGTRVADAMIKRYRELSEKIPFVEANAGKPVKDY